MKQGIVLYNKGARHVSRVVARSNGELHRGTPEHLSGSDDGQQQHILHRSVCLTSIVCTQCDEFEEQKDVLGSEV